MIGLMLNSNLFFKHFINLLHRGVSLIISIIMELISLSPTTYVSIYKQNYFVNATPF